MEDKEFSERLVNLYNEFCDYVFNEMPNFSIQDSSFDNFMKWLKYKR